MIENHKDDYTGSIMICHVPDQVPSVVYVTKKLNRDEDEDQAYAVERLNTGTISWPAAKYLRPFDHEDFKRTYYLEKSKEAERDAKRYQKLHDEV